MLETSEVPPLSRPRPANTINVSPWLQHPQQEQLAPSVAGGLQQRVGDAPSPFDAQECFTWPQTLSRADVVELLTAGSDELGGGFTSAFRF